MEQLAQIAIRAALQGNWVDAEKSNKQILKDNPGDVDALNRLARAQAELGKIPTAIATYKKAIKLDPYNGIARRALERLPKLKKSGKKGKDSGDHIVETAFLEEPGKTKTISLIHLGDEAVINNLDAGNPVNLAPHAHRVSVETEEGKYIGRLPDDLSRRIIKLTRAGNEYKALVRSVNDDKVKIFIKERKRAPQLADIPSFPGSDQGKYVSFTSPELVHDGRPEVSTLEDEDEEGKF